MLPNNMYNMYTSCDNTIISDITETNNTVNSFDFNEKIIDIRVKTENELNKLNVDGLKDKCKELYITGFSKQKKPELVQTLLLEFNKLIDKLKDKKANELKNICKQQDIKCSFNSKKEILLCNILEYLSSTLKFKIDDTIVKDTGSYKEQNIITSSEPTNISLIENLEKQRKEIELKMEEELEKQRKIEEETKRKLEEEEKKRVEELKKIEKEEAKKKKQSIPKQVRTIVWNHYIGEDIIKHKCLCCKKVTITNTNFDVGHVQSEKNGGTHEINNLRPICGACNHSMGSENMIDFVVKYGLYIG